VYLQTVDIVNPPAIKCPNGDWVNVSFRTSKFHGIASKVAGNKCGAVQKIVPKSIA